MAITFNMVCDRCESHTDILWKVGITCERTGPDIRERYHTPTRRQEADWCDNCIREMGVIKPLVRADEVTPATTMEDIVKKIVEESNGGSES